MFSKRKKKRERERERKRERELAKALLHLRFYNKNRERSFIFILNYHDCTRRYCAMRAYQIKSRISIEVSFGECYCAATI